MIAFRPYALPENNFTFMHHPIAWQPRSGVTNAEVLCEKEWDYSNSLANIWNADDDLMIIEHDIAFPLAAYDDLVNCPASLCVPMYRLYPASTGLEKKVWAHRRQGKDFLEWIPMWQEWVPYAGLGMAKLNRIIRQVFNTPPRNVHWKLVDTAISQYLSELGATQWHVHNIEVEHLHKKPDEFNPFQLEDDCDADD